MPTDLHEADTPLGDQAGEETASDVPKTAAASSTLNSCSMINFLVW